MQVTTAASVFICNYKMSWEIVPGETELRSPVESAVLQLNGTDRNSNQGSSNILRPNKVQDIAMTTSKPKVSWSEWFAASGIGKFMSDDPDKVHYEDYDAGVNALALLSALMLSIPYEVIGHVNYEYLDFLHEQLNECAEGDSSHLGYGQIYSLYRGSFLATVYMAISGMILATFYFLFKRNNTADYLLWRKKARWLVISLFLSTALAIMSLILLTNMLFDYYLISSEENMCDNGTAPFVIPGIASACISFLWGFYLIF